MAALRLELEGSRRQQPGQEPKPVREGGHGVESGGIGVGHHARRPIGRFQNRGYPVLGGDLIELFAKVGIVRGPAERQRSLQFGFKGERQPLVAERWHHAEWFGRVGSGFRSERRARNQVAPRFSLEVG